MVDILDEIATTFNNYFTNIGQKLSSKIDPVTGWCLDYIKASVDKTMYRILTTTDEILEICSILHSSKSVGFDNFSLKAIKTIICNIAPTLRDIFYNSLSMGILPANLK